VSWIKLACPREIPRTLAQVVGQSVDDIAPSGL